MYVCIYIYIYIHIYVNLFYYPVMFCYANTDNLYSCDLHVKNAPDHLK